MGNQQHVPQARRYQQSPFICCGQQPKRYQIQQQSTQIKNPQKSNYSKIYRATDSKQGTQQPMRMQETGQTYYNKNQMSIFRKPENRFADSSLEMKRQGKDGIGLFKSRQKQSQLQQNMKKSQSTKYKSTYGAFHKPSTFGSYSLYNSGINTSSIIKQHQKPQRDIPKITQKTSIVQNVAQRDIKPKIRNYKKQSPNQFIGQSQFQYSGRAQQFQNSKKIIQFLQDNKIKDATFKFYDTTDNSFLLNNSTILMAKKKASRKYQQQQQQISNSNLNFNQNLSKIQQPIQLNLQIDAKIILATCLLIIGVVIVIIGSTVVYSQTGFFICLMIGIILYVCYMIICYIYNDVFMYLFNVRSFQQFQNDYKQLIQTQGEFAYHIHLQNEKKVIKECYLLSKYNQFTKIQDIQNQNKVIELDQLKNKQTSFLMIKFKTKTSFFDAQSQYNTIRYFNEFLDQHKAKANAVKYDYDKKNIKKSKFNQQKQQQFQKKSDKNKISIQAQNKFFKMLQKTNFNYQINAIPNLTHKPQSALTVCYMQDSQDAGWFILLFILFTLFGLCLPFLCFFQAYTKRYRINILNRFKVA